MCNHETILKEAKPHYEKSGNLIERLHDVYVYVHAYAYVYVIICLSICIGNEPTHYVDLNFVHNTISVQSRVAQSKHQADSRACVIPGLRTSWASSSSKRSRSEPSKRVRATLLSSDISLAAMLGG